MPRRTRRRRRLTVMKKSQKFSTDPDAPNEVEWETMTGYGIFVVLDDDDEKHHFKRGDTAILLPEHVSPESAENLAVHKHWVAKIKDIRAREETKDVWVRVQWYWSGEDVAGLIKSFDASHCGHYERILSDQFDLVSSLCFNGIASVIKYDEHSLDQPKIQQDQFYTRYTLECGIRNINPKPIGTCICKRPYNPDHDSIMHFCPRPSCRNAYHQDCLIQANLTEPPNSIDRDFRLLACSPDTDATFSLSDLVVSTTTNVTAVATPDHPSSPRKKKKGRVGRPPKKQQPHPQQQPQLSTESTTTCPSETTSQLLLSLPTDLVAAAQQPIVKGGSSTSVGDIVGNVCAVVEARRMVYRAISGESSIPDNWREIVPESQSGKDPQAFPALICPECNSPI